jgi:hypothetical protein
MQQRCSKRDTYSSILVAEALEVNYTSLVEYVANALASLIAVIENPYVYTIYTSLNDLPLTALSTKERQRLLLHWLCLRQHKEYELPYEQHCS